MDRATVYTQEQGRSVDFLFAQRAAMIGLAKLSQAALGSNTVVRGLAVTPNSPAALNVLVGTGEIYSMADVDATDWGSLPADTSDVIFKQGLNMTAQTLSTPAPSTAGYSINYLIEAQYEDQDTNPVVLPFYNSANPSQPLNGQGNGGATLPTQRQGICAIQVKAGVAAATGTQVTPSVDSGWTALAVVTVANGQTQVLSGNISVPAGVPQITSLLQMMQTDSLNYAVAGGTSDAITATLPFGVSALTDGFPVTIKLAAANTTTTPSLNLTLGTTATGAMTIVKGANAALVAGDLPGSGAEARLVYNATNANWVLTNPATGVTNSNGAQVQTVGASVASNALTMTYTPVGSLSWRNPTLTSGAPVSMLAAAIGNQSIMVPSGATLGSISGQASQLVLLEAYNAGSPVLCVANLAGGLDLSETNLISPTTISSGATSANVIYSASAVAANSPYRVVGVITMPGQTTAGTWATDHTAAQGIGGMAYAAMQSLGYGQTWKNVTASRALGTTYYNTTARPISVHVAVSVSSNPSTIQLMVSGVLFQGASVTTSNSSVTAIVPVGGTYAASISGSGTLNTWNEMS